jgi:hypothetical protein
VLASVPSCSYCRGLLNHFIPDVYVYPDHYKGPDSGNSPGFGISLIATSTSGCVYGAQRNTGAAAGVRKLPGDERSSGSGGTEVPEDVGTSAASLLLDEIARGGCVDTNVQSLVFTLMALGPEDVSRVRLGQLGPAGIATLRLLKQFFDAVVRLKTDVQHEAPEESATVTKSTTAADDEDDEDDGSEDEDEEEGSGGGGGSSKKKSKKKSKKHSGKKRGRGDDDFDDGEDGAANRKKRRKDDGTVDPAEFLAQQQPLAVEVKGGHSGKTIIASCLGLGYRNFAKKVT